MKTTYTYGFRNLFVLLLGLVCSLIIPSWALAETSTSPFSSQLCIVFNAMSSTPTLVAAALGIIYVGFKVIGGEMRWQQALTISAGIIVAVQAQTIVNWINGSTNSMAC